MNQKESKQTLENRKPGAALAKFMSKNFKYGKHQNNNLLAPKMAFVSRKNIEKKEIAEFDAREEALSKVKQEYEACGKKDIKRRQELKKEFELLKNSELPVSKNIRNIDLDELEFLSDLQTAIALAAGKPEDIQGHINDAELRGLIDIFTNLKGAGKNASDAIKKIVTTIGFVSVSDQLKTISDIFINLITNVDKFRTKVFNIVFEHPVNSTNKNYLLRNYKHFDTILKSITQKTSREDILEEILKLELFEHTSKELDIKQFGDLIRQNIDSDSYEWIKKLDKKYKKTIRQIIDSVKSSGSCIDFLVKHDLSNLKENLPQYTAMMEEIYKISLIQPENTTIENFIKTLVKVLRRLRAIDPRDNKIHGKDGKAVHRDKLDTDFYKIFNAAVPLKMKKNTKHKIFECVYADADPVFVAESKTSGPSYEFTVEEFKYLTEAEAELLDKEVYARFGTISDSKLPKNIRIAVGLRTISEIMRKIKDLEILHKGKDNFTVSLVC